MWGDVVWGDWMMGCGQKRRGILFFNLQEPVAP